MAGGETRKEQLEREHGELLEELRSLIPGAEVLFGFLLAIRFTGQFAALDDTQRYVYYATLMATAISLVLLLAPASHHRLRFREGDKDYLLRKGNREAIAGTLAIAVAFTGVVYLITALVFGDAEAIVVATLFFAFTAWRWWSLALYRAYRQRS
jgi:Flp pilus assembly protein TadB